VNDGDEGPLPETLLNAHQRRHFEVVLGMLEDTLSRIEQLAQGGTSSSMLTIVEDDLPADFATRAAPQLAAVRERITSLADTLQLRPRRLSRRRTVRALLTAEVVRLEDSSAARLRGYGTVDPRFADAVGTVVEEIIRELRSLSSQLSGSPPSTR
jgi:hypothetical protein